MNTRTVALRVLSVLVSFSTSALSQPHGTLTEKSYAHAREVLERGIQALGGLKAFQAVESIQFKSSARVPEDGQSASPDAALYIRPLDTEGVMDLAHRRYSLLRMTNYIGSGPRGSSIVTTENTGFTADLRSNAVYPFAPAAITANNRAMQRTFPNLLLQLALNRAATLRWLGEEDYGGRKQDVISFIDADGAQFTLCLDAGTGVLTKTEGLSDSFLKGLAASETVFSDYRPVSGVAMPFHVVSRLAGETTADATYSEITFNTHPDASIFDMPKDAVIGPQVGGPRQPITLTKLAKDVYYVDAIETGSIFFYSSLFVALKDYVLVFESPLGDNVSQAIIARIKETVPGKPIRYLVPTHYHVDHTAGVRGYIAEGTTVVTTPGNRKFVEELAAVAHPLNPDRLSREPRPVSIETFTGKRVFSDGEHVVELYDVGPTPHVDEMIMAYFPHEKLVFVSDLFLVSYKGRNGPAEPSTVLFNDKIRALGLQVETIAGGHGRIATMEELKQSLADKPAQAR
jgi:glyoxylase-like metal-dependent hydrolase (beta-lactamase superfamily II)